MVLITSHVYRGNHALITHTYTKMKDSNEENSVEIVNSDDEIVVTVGRVEAEVTTPSEDSIIKTIRDYFCRERERLTMPINY